MLTNRNKAQFIILAAFVLGVIAGASGQYLLRPSLGPQGATTANNYEEMAVKLNLTADQRRQADEILREARGKYLDLRQRMRPESDRIRDDAKARIRSLLDPQQQLIFDNMVKDLDDKREQQWKDELSGAARPAR